MNLPHCEVCGVEICGGYSYTFGDVCPKCYDERVEVGEYVVFGLHEVPGEGLLRELVKDSI